MKKIIFTLVLAISVCLPMTAFADYVVPADSYYVNVQTNQLGELIIYVPYNVARYLAYNDSTKSIVNTYSSQISAVGFDGSYWYNVRFPTFETPTYRRVDATNIYNDLNITRLNETNITFLNDTDFTAFSNSNLATLATLLIGGCILLCLFMKRS